jgi:4-hydroxymandelate oxidase
MADTQENAADIVAPFGFRMDSGTEIADIRATARARVSRDTWELIFGTPDGDLEAYTCRAENSWKAIQLVPRVLVDMSVTNTATTVLGEDIALPILIAPMGQIQRLHPDGELAVARAAASNGTGMILSSFSGHGFEEVSACTEAPLWFQLYVQRDRGLTVELIRLAEAAGCSAIAVTVDINGADPRWHRLPDNGADGFALFDGLDLVVPPHKGVDPALDWSIVEWLRQQTALPIVLKGIQAPDDAVRAGNAGAQAIVVSSHGGFALEGASAPSTILPAIADAAESTVEIYVDGGVRRGTDVLKALALGARAVLVGRPMLWGLAAAGQAGVEVALSILREELETAMLHCGVPDASAVPADRVRSHWERSA